MHLVLLGVCKRLINLWWNVIPYKISRVSKNAIKANILNARSEIPNDIVRKPRSLSVLVHCKASEFRTFLFYLSPIILKNKLSHTVYQHFMLLVCAMHILRNRSAIADIAFEKYAHKQLLAFVETFLPEYKGSKVVYNIHSLIHLTAEVEQFGPLDALRFENHLGKMKSHFHLSMEKLLDKCDDFSYPCKSSLLQIYRFNAKSNEIGIKSCEIKCKVFCWYHRSYYYVIPL